jgi:hypothetical protein
MTLARYIDHCLRSSSSPSIVLRWFHALYTVTEWPLVSQITMLIYATDRIKTVMNYRTLHQNLKNHCSQTQYLTHRYTYPLIEHSAVLLNTSDPPSLCCSLLNAHADLLVTTSLLSVGWLLYRCEKAPLLSAKCSYHCEKIPLPSTARSRYCHAKIPSPSVAYSLRLHEETPCVETVHVRLFMQLLNTGVIALLDPSILFQTMLSISFSRTLEKVPVVHPFNSKALVQQQV